MKKYALVVALLAIAFVGSDCAGERPVRGVRFGPRCRSSSWSAMRYGYYGDKETIVKKLREIPVNLSERRVFLQVTQGDSSATVRLFEQEEGGTYTVTQWKTNQTSHLLADIDDAIRKNQGVNCVGEQVKAVLKQELKHGEVSSGIPAPASPTAAFAHPINEASGKFITTTVFVLC